MKETLSKAASELVCAGREALRPKVGDQERMRALLEYRLPRAGTLQQRLETATSTGSRWLRVLGAAVGVGSGVAVVLLIATRPAAPPAPPNDVAAEAQLLSKAEVSAPAIAELQPKGAVSTPGSSSVQRSTVPSVRTKTNPDRSDGLREEVGLLTEAQKEFKGQHLSRALALVDEHGRKFRQGALVRERIKLRSRILCALGRNAEANAEQTRLPRSESGQPSPPPGGDCGSTLAN